MRDGKILQERQYKGPEPGVENPPGSRSRVSERAWAAPESMGRSRTLVFMELKMRERGRFP